MSVATRKFVGEMRVWQRFFEQRIFAIGCWGDDLEEADMREQFEAFLPWYVNGTLNADEQAWVTGYLARNPDARREVDRLATMRDDMRTQLEPPPGDVGWSRLARRIADEKRATRPSWLDGLRELVARFATPPAFALAAGLAVIQFGVIGLMLSHQSRDAENYAAYRSLPASASGAGPILQIAFKQDATERAMRLLLVEIDGTLVGGPGQLGTYFVAVPAAKLDAARRRAAESPIVETVATIPSLPVKD